MYIYCSNWYGLCDQIMPPYQASLALTKVSNRNISSRDILIKIFWKNVMHLNLFFSLHLLLYWYLSILGDVPGGSGRQIALVELPAEIIVKILQYMSYKEISAVRRVCRRLNELCAARLNTTFQRLQSQMLVRFQTIKVINNLLTTGEPF